MLFVMIGQADRRRADQAAGRVPVQEAHAVHHGAQGRPVRKTHNFEFTHQPRGTAASTSTEEQQNDRMMEALSAAQC